MKTDRTARIEQEMIDEILVSLSQEKIPWKRPWKTTGNLCMNAVTGNVYKNSNQFFLMMKSMMMGYKDPRWATFKQANDAGWRIKSGAVGSWIYKVRFYDPVGRCDVTAEYLAEKTAEEVEEIRNRSRFIRKFHKVFNADQIEGIPPLRPEEAKSIVFTNDLARRFAENSLSAMGVELNHGGNRAYYRPADDCIQMPLKEQFEDESGYYGTLLHETGHATGAKHRLGRTQNTDHHSQEYAKEELVAELTSAFLGIDLGLETDGQHLEQHKAYCQSWYAAIKEDREVFFDALKQAQEARVYLHEKGRYMDLYKELKLAEHAENAKELSEAKEDVQEKQEEKVEEKKEFSVTLDELKSISIKDYAASAGYHVMPISGNLYQLEEHDSCRIYPNNTFFRFSTRKGGSLIDFIMEFEDLDLKGAVKKATEYYYENNPSLVDTQTLSANQKVRQSRITDIEMPTKSSTTKNVFAYLNKTRCIDEKIINRYIKEGMLYQDESGNCVFAGKVDGKIMNGFVRSSSPSSKFRHDVKGSFKEVGIFMHNPDAKTLVVTEAVIEQMSYQTLDPKANEKDFLSVNGVSNAVAACRFHFAKRAEAQNIQRVILALNNDDAGTDSVVECSEWFKENHPEIEVCVHFPQNKDFNEDLQMQVNGMENLPSSSKEEITMEKGEMMYVG